MLAALQDWHLQRLAVQGTAGCEKLKMTQGCQHSLCDSASLQHFSKEQSLEFAKHVGVLLKMCWNLSVIPGHDMSIAILTGHGTLLFGCRLSVTTALVLASNSRWA